MHVGQPEAAALEFVGQAFVSDAEQVQHSRLDVVHLDFKLRCQIAVMIPTGVEALHEPYASLDSAVANRAIRLLNANDCCRVTSEPSVALSLHRMNRPACGDWATSRRRASITRRLEKPER